MILSVQLGYVNDSFIIYKVRETPAFFIEQFNIKLIFFKLKRRYNFNLIIGTYRELIIIFQSLFNLLLTFDIYIQNFPNCHLV